MRDVSKVDVEGISDEQILHSAVGILRRDIEKLKISVKDDPKSQTTSRLLWINSELDLQQKKSIFADLYLEILTKSAAPC